MKLYYSKGACSLTIRIALHEMNLACEFESVNLRTKQTQTGADFLKINSKGQVPTLVLDNNEVLTENTAILQYLADTHHAAQLLPPLDNFKRYRVIEWLSFINSDLHKVSGALFHPTLPDEIKESIFKPSVKNKLTFIDTHLAKNKFLLADQFTLADGYLFVILTWMGHFKIDLASFSNVARYFNELKLRPSIQESLKEDGFTAHQA